MADEIKQPQTLAEFLGTLDPTKPLAGQNPEPPCEDLTAKDFSKKVLQSQTYRDSLLRRIMLDELPPALECKLYDYAYGKPVERVEVRELPADYSDLTDEQLKERLRQAADRLAEPDPPVLSVVEKSSEEQGSFH